LPRVILQGAAAVIVVLLLVAPGLTWVLAGERPRPAAGSSNFREWARVALASVIFSALALGAVALVRALRPSAMPDPGQWFDSKEHPQYAARHYTLITRAVVLEVAIACGLAAVIQFVRTLRMPSFLRRLARPGSRFGTWVRRLRPPRRVIQRSTLWTIVHTSGAAPELVPMLSVKMQDGTTWSGDISAVGHFDSRADTDIALEGEIKVARRDGEERLLERPWARVLLPMSEVSEIIVGWREPNANEQ
jgi:hypothetical protein